MKQPLYTNDGKKAGDVTLNDAIFAAAWNADLMHQVTLAYQANARQANAHTKDRSEVSGTGKKPWRQKGTGNARHGSKRSPIWVGGGVAHGPRNGRDYSQKINRKVKVTALAMALSHKVTEKQVICAEALTPKDTKTKSVMNSLEALAGIDGFNTINTLKNKNNILIISAGYDQELVKAAQNLPHVTVFEARDVNALAVMKARYVILSDTKVVDEVLTDRKTAILTKQNLTKANA